MSQKKVELYKEYKKNKAQILKRERFIRRLEYGIIIVLCCFFVGWFGYSVYRSATRAEQTGEVVATEVDMNAYTDYVGGLATTFAED